MTQKIKPTILLFSFIFTALSLAPAAFAVECDQDRDGFIALNQDMLEEVVLDNAYQSDGNYASAEWQAIFNAYKNGVSANGSLDASYLCDSLNFKKGAEPARCDSPVLNSGSGVYDTAKVTSLTGGKVNPGTFDAPDNGIDEDCDGADGQLIPGDSGGGKDLGGLAQKAITMLGRAVAVISIAILIWGGILYATAAGDEQKTSKARKAILGAIIGLIVGLLAPSIVSFVTSSLA